ncbi:MAG: hypothetical protein IKD68_09170 [Solobacterium sp.]|nr:hypothetical protein [Solobacterium sp.]
MKHLILPSDVSASPLPYTSPDEQTAHSGFTSDQDLPRFGKPSVPLTAGSAE